MKPQVLSVDLQSRVEPEGRVKQAADIIFTHSPQFLFEEYTFLDKDWAEAVARRCLACNAIPLIEYYAPREGWLFHSLAANGVMYKKGCAAFFQKRPAEPVVEREFECEISTYLNSRGITHRRQVECAAGVADIVTDVAVVEVKLRPSNDARLKAVGQAVAYRTTLDRPLAAIVVLDRHPAWLRVACRSVDVRCFTRKTLSEMANWIMEVTK